MKIDCHYFSCWPYDDALLFMHNAWLHVQQQPHTIMIGCGSHRETITIGRHDKTASAVRVILDALIRYLDRGGGMTAHEPGQIVLYPIFHIERLGLDVPSLILLLEDTMLNFLAEIGLCGHRHASGPGVFVDDKKIGFLGLRIKERVTQHGIAINLFNDAEIFQHFDPCGVKDLPITSACHHLTLPFTQKHYEQRLVYFFLRNLWARTDMGTSFDEGVLLSKATERSGISSLASGK